MKHISLFMLALLVLVSCGDGKADAARALAEAGSDTATTEAEYLLDLHGFDMPLVVSLPEVLNPDADSLYGRAVWNEEFGHLRVAAGDGFGITITEDEGDIARLKADLERDMLRRNTILEETPDKIVYRSEFPDEDLVFVHFYQVVRHNGRSFVVESMPDQRFNEAEVARMSTAVRVATAV